MRHFGFNVYSGDRIYPIDAHYMENLSRYIVRESFLTERLSYIADDSKVIYKSKTKSRKLLNIIHGGSKSKYIFFDEIQNLYNWEFFVNKL